MWTQIVGKTRLALAPMENHWWQVALYVTPRGLTTSSMPSGAGALEVEFDFLDHQLYVRDSGGAARAIPLVPRTVADFYAAYVDTLRSLGHAVRIRPVPVEVETAIPFAKDREHAAYDADAAQRWWRILARTEKEIKTFGVSDLNLKPEDVGLSGSYIQLEKIFLPPVGEGAQMLEGKPEEIASKVSLPISLLFFPARTSFVVESI